MYDGLAREQLYMTVDILILTVRDGRLHLLLARRGKSPYEGRWALPGSFIRVQESAEGTVKRLLEEMLPIQNAFFEQLYTFTAVDRDPRGRVISVAYLVIVPWRNLKRLMAEEEISFRCWRADMDEGGLRLTDGTGAAIVPEALAFDHGKIIETGIERLRGKIAYTDIGFRFLENPRAFSLSELQTVFEAVLGKTLDSSNFRRAILNRYEKTGRLTQTVLAEQRGRGRPAVLYRFND